MSITNVAAFTSCQLRLLSAELNAEEAENKLLLSAAAPASIARAGLGILNLIVSSQRTGLGGRTVIDLQLDPAVGNGKEGGAGLADHGIRTGDIVSIREQLGGAARKRDKTESEKNGVSGVVLRVSGGNGPISLALDGDDVEVPSTRVWIVKIANEVTYKRTAQAMMSLSSLSSYTTLMLVLFGKSSPTPVSLTEMTHDWIDPTLNDSQKDAVTFALYSREVALIHGPPGTGKTHTLMEIILQTLRRNPEARVLVCGPSNISVDNIVERLSSHKVPMVRLGHPARLLPSVLNHSLDFLSQTSDAAAIVRDIREEMDKKQGSVRKSRSGGERRAIYRELKELRKEFRDRERACVDQLVRSSRVVLSTLHGAGGAQLKGTNFDLLIIDEASQALEAQCWIPILTGVQRLVLAGDHLQLPPTIKSVNPRLPQVTKTKGLTQGEELEDSTTLAETLFDRLLKLHGSCIKRMLTTQYRMHEKIMAFPSSELYEQRLLAAESVKLRLLKDLPYPVEETSDTVEPLVFYDTQGGEFPEKTEEEHIGQPGRDGSILNLTESKSNELEALIVHQHVRKLVEAGVRPSDIAVVVPYTAQLGLVSRSLKPLFPDLEFGTVDGFQGREKEAVIVSLVRSNDKRLVGFLGEKRRLNVAMTRPRRHLCVVGDSQTVSFGSPFLKHWMAYLEENADLRYPDIADILSETTAA